MALSPNYLAHLLKKQTGRTFTELLTERRLEHARGLPKLATWPQIASVLETSISEIVSNGKPVKGTLDEAARQVEQIARRAGGRRRG